jgi:hypothetical protein
MQPTSRNLPYAAFMHSEFVLMYLDFHRARLHVEHHVHLARVLCALHLLCPKLDETPVKEVSSSGQFCILERAVWYINWLYTLLSPSNFCDC